MKRLLLSALVAAAGFHAADAHALTWTPSDDGVQCATATVPHPLITRFLTACAADH